MRARSRLLPRPAATCQLTTLLWWCRNARCGHFRRIFPSPNAYTYRRFFEEARPLNDLLADHLFHVTAREAAAKRHGGSEMRAGLSPRLHGAPSIADIRVRAARWCGLMCGV